MQVACVLIRNFPFRVEIERSPSLSGCDVLLVQSTGSRRAVLDTSPSISDVFPGDSLQEALSIHPNAIQCEADPPLYEQRFEGLLDYLEQVSPVVQGSDIGCAYVGLDGLARMYHGENGLFGALKRAVPAELEPRIGVGPGKFPAAVAASTACPGEVVVAPVDLESFLAGHSVDVLPVPVEVRTRLKRLSMPTLREIARQRVGPMQAQFGPAGRRIWELAQGIDNAHLIPRRHEVELTDWVSFPTPIVASETILLAAESLLVRLFDKPEMLGRRARLVLLEASIFRRTTWQRRVPFKDAVGDFRNALPAIKHALSLTPPPGPIEDLSLTLMGITGRAGRQASLFPDVRKRDQLRESLRQLEARLGRRPPIYRFKEAEPWSRIPERRMVLVEYSP